MTPQEKANELVRKYYTWGINKDGQTLSWLESKQCALITVDEILVVIKKNFINNVALHNGELSYWQQVKQEIEKL